MPHAPATAPTTDGAPLFVVFNHRSGRGDADAAIDTIRTACERAGRQVTIHRVGKGSPPHAVAKRAVEEARTSGGIVVAAGGDGTLNAVAQAVLGSGCAYGVLPQGTFNYFGRTHGIPTELEKSLQVLLTGRAQRAQAALVNERVFIVNASVGLYARLLEERESFKSQYGRSRLVALVAALVTLTLRGRRLMRLKLSMQGREAELPTPTLFVGNNSLQLEQVGLDEAPAPEEGELAAVAVCPVGRLALLGLLVRGGLGRLGRADDVMSTRVRSLRVEAARGVPDRRVKVAADGEVQWMRLPLHFRVAPDPLWLIKPEPSQVQEHRK